MPPGWADVKNGLPGAGIPRCEPFRRRSASCAAAIHAARGAAPAGNRVTIALAHRPALASDPALRPVISFHGVGKTYASGTVALRDIDLAIYQRDFVLLVGASGAQGLLPLVAEQDFEEAVVPPRRRGRPR